MNKLHTFPYINTMIEDLNSVMLANLSLKWRDGDPPSPDILEARLRAKMYGAQVITYRHFLRMVLNSRYEGTGADMEISKPIMEFARKCIRALFFSAQAFWGMKGGRLVVTNVWGTSHAYVPPFLCSVSVSPIFLMLRFCFSHLSYAPFLFLPFLSFPRFSFSTIFPSTPSTLPQHTSHHSTAQQSPKLTPLTSQWGNVIVLHAAYMHPMLRPYVPARELMELTQSVREFLVSVAHPSSALADDIRILDYAIERSGARGAAAAAAAKQAARGGNGPRVGGGSFGSSGSEMGAPGRM
jgi:hypothetical protein